MHSKNTSTRTSNKKVRLTPYLITVGVGFSMAGGAIAAAPEMENASQEEVQEAPAEAPLESEIPAPTIDTNGDGTADAWDRSGNGQPDAWDTDADGRPDLLDDDGDGQPD